MKPLIHDDEIYLYAKNLEQEKYQKLMKKMSEMGKQVGYNKLNVSNYKIIPESEMITKIIRKLLYSTTTYVKKIRDS